VEEMPYIDGASDAATTYPIPYVADADHDRPAGIAGQGIVLGAFHSSSLLVEMSASRAQEQLKNEYRNFEIARPGPLSYRLKTYYIPWLNLFPDADAGVPDAPSLCIEPLPARPPPARLSEAELQLLYDVKNQPPGRVVIEFDKDFIEVDGNNTGSYTLPVPPLTPSIHEYNVRSMSTPVRIRCIKEISDPEGSRVVVRAFGQNAQPSDPGARAGELRVCPNTRAHHQKEIKIALVCVRTNIEQRPKPGPVIGVFRDKEVVQIFRTMHQALLRPDIANLDEAGKPFVLDLSDPRTAPEFHDPALYTPSGLPAPPGIILGKYVAPNPWELGTWMIENYDDNLHSCLVDRFNAERVSRGLTAITDRYFIFGFGASAPFGGIADGPSTRVSVSIPSGHPGLPGLPPGATTGHVKETRWRPSTIVVHGRGDATAAHEILHALTLRHTHRDWTPLTSGHTAEWTYLGEDVPCISVGCKYLFPRGTTTNIMSYSDDKLRLTTWRWQWAIMQANTTIAPDDWTLGKEEKSV
jgi:hypothetical protein